MNKAKERYNEAKEIVDEKAISIEDIMEMDFTQFKKFKNELKKTVNISTSERLNIKDFILNIRQYIKEAKDIKVQSTCIFNDNVISYRMIMTDGIVWHFIIRSSFNPCDYILGNTFILIKNPESAKVCERISLNELKEDKLLDITEEDLGTFILYLNELCEAKKYMAKIKDADGNLY